MLTFDESQLALDEIACALPQAIFRGLNGGYALTHDTKKDENGLYILGQYHVQPHGLGRYVTIHYGSLIEIYGHLSEKSFRKKLKEVLHHELIHHLESLAGDRSLEIQDEIDKARYLKL
jgi:hypothetical protein